MIHRHVKILILSCLCAVVLGVIACQPADSNKPTNGISEAPQVIQNPDGGRLFIKNFPKATEKTAVGDMLKGISQLFGDKPIMGNFLRDKYDNILLAFFEVKAVKTDGKRYLGLILVAPIAGGHQSAVILDEARRFPHTEPQMLKMLFGSPYARYNPGSVRLPWGTDLVRAWSAALPIRCRALGLPLMDVRITRTQKMNADPGWTSVYVDGLMDRHDRAGLRDFRAQLSGANTGNGVWTLYETSIQLPQNVSAQVLPTAMAMVSSFRMNNQVIKDAYQVRLQGQRAAFESQQASHRSQIASIESQHAGYWARQDSNARQSQGFQNYMLDRTVMVDNEGRRETISNTAATSLMKIDPSRF